MSTKDDNSSEDANSSTGAPPPPPPSPPSSSPPPPPEENSSPPPPSKNNNSPPSSDKPSPPPPNDKSQTPSKSDSGSSSNSKNSNSSPSPPSTSSPGSNRGALAPPKDKSNSSNTEQTSHNEKIIIAGVSAGAVFLLMLMIICLVSCARRRKRKKHNAMQYYRDNPHGNRGSDYYNSGGWHNSKAQSNEYAMKMPPSGQLSSDYGWPGQHLPPPHMMNNSGELGSANFSGSQYPPLPPQRTSVCLGFNQSSFSYEDLASATGGFSNSNLLGQGGFGFVHKGVLQNGKEVAIKSLKANSGQGEREFQAEVDIISRVHHRHLVSLVGYCIAGSQRMLVYEFVPNGTLEYHLHGKGSPNMDFPTRLKIALGSAKGFAYLHEDCHPRIIHRDIKVANILLDDNFDAQVADFGLAKLSSDTQSHVSTRIMGTFGYMAPEYASSGKLTEKSDVYSFGVVLLELITGKRPIDIHSEDEDTLVDWAMPILLRAVEGGSYEEIVDPQLNGNYDPQGMLAMIACAAACVRQSARKRPKMSQIVRALEGDMTIDSLHEGMKKLGLSTQEFTSGEQ